MTKYHAKKTRIGNLVFSSKKEAARYIYLKALERAGQIKNLRLQVPFILASSVVLNGRKKPSLKYYADFVYEENGKTIVEDVKSKMTRGLTAYRIKKHLMKSVHGIDILET